MQRTIHGFLKPIIRFSFLVLFLLGTVLFVSAKDAVPDGKLLGEFGLLPVFDADHVSEAGRFSATDVMQEGAVSTARFKTAPADLPSFTITRGDGAIGDGYIFMAYFNYFQLEQSAYLLILDNNGEPIFHKKLAPVPIAMDFKKQVNGLLTYYPVMADGSFHTLDDSYQLVGNFSAGNGYPTDLHELQVLENGHALLMVHDTRTIDMSELAEGGHPEAQVTGCIIQEIDADQNVVFEWQSWDHIPITDSTLSLTRESISYIHCNAIDLDDDGNILITSRHLDEITKINRQSGEIIWRLGGKENDFSFLNDAVPFNFPHDARRLDNGHISIFDNGVAHSPPFSRGIEYEVDEENMTVSQVREIRNNPDRYSRAMGNMQRLPNGNSIIGWGRSIDVPVFTEFDANGQKVLEFDTRPGYGSYRVFRFPWKGYPTWPPDLWVEESDGIAKLYFSWNGSTETAAFKLYGGRNRSQLQLLATIEKSGFETTYEYEAAKKGLWYFQVVPVDHQGQTGPASKLVPLAVGQNPLFFPVVQSLAGE